MALLLEDYKRLVERLDYADLDLDEFRERPLHPDHLRVLRYMHDVENHTSCYLRNLLNTRAHDDPEITAFLTLWNFEELWHGEALGRVLEAHGEDGTVPRVGAMRRRVRRTLGESPLFWIGVSKVTKHFLAAHMTVGVINEWTTQAGYARLAQLSDHPTLQELLRRIMRQEGRHIDFYLTQARGLLGASEGARRTVRFLLSRTWKPVGASVMPEAETGHVIRTLFGDTPGETLISRVDRRIDALPGLEGLGLMAKARREYGVAA